MKANVSGVHGQMGQKVNGFSVHIRLLVKGYFLLHLSLFGSSCVSFVVQ